MQVDRHVSAAKHLKAMQAGCMRYAASILVVCILVLHNDTLSGNDGPNSDGLVDCKVTYFDVPTGNSDSAAKTEEYTPDGGSGPVRFHFSDSDLVEIQDFYDQTSVLRQTTMLQPTPFLEPSLSIESTSRGRPLDLRTEVSDSGITPISNRRSQPERVSLLPENSFMLTGFHIDLISGNEAHPLSTTDLGSLLKKSPRAISVQAQTKTPIVNDPKVRGSRVEALAASGSYWVPARADLDTVISKIDSRLVERVIVIPGPYTSRYGPAYRFTDFELNQSPRYEYGREVHGRTAFDYQTNGEQWFGLQSLQTGGRAWGVRADYIHRTGSDYTSGDGNRFASSYKSREFSLSLGRDIHKDYTVELSLLRLDQTDVEFPGYAFDIDFLVTDGFGITLTNRDPIIGDQIETECWYNRTRFEGNSSSPSKLELFPTFPLIGGVTDVDSLSTGYRRGRSWGDEFLDWSFTVGHDLRFVKQELNEIGSLLPPGAPFPVTDRNSPIPRSFQVNPGLFFEYTERFAEDFSFQAGARVDFVQSDIVDDPAKLEVVGFDSPIPNSYADTVGTSEFQTDRVLLGLYGTLNRRISDAVTVGASLGYAQRPPSITELYAAEPYLLLLQNGLNTVTGDPSLGEERVAQADWVVDIKADNLSAGFRGFYMWGRDYITFEAMSVSPSAGAPQQVNLRYVNTELATLAGFETFAEWRPNDPISPFFRMRYTRGEDTTRNGTFATIQASGGAPLFEDRGQARGQASGITDLPDTEPLPGIAPLETNLGVRLTDPSAEPLWNILFSSRIVASQTRVAASLLEQTTPGFVVLDLRGTWRSARHRGLLLVGGVENLTDVEYQEHFDFRSFEGTAVFQPGVNFYTGIDFAY